MAGRVEGKVAFITGAARGQGRSHAVRLAQEGADIIAVDMCAPVDSVPYPLSTPDDLAETADLIKANGRRVVTAEVDVRDSAGLKAAVDSGVEQLGQLNIVIANAGIGNGGESFDQVSDDDWQTMIDINMTGVWKTAKAAAPHLIASGPGGSVILTGGLNDGTAGLFDIKANGGTAIVQDPEDSSFAAMPRSALANVARSLMRTDTRFVRSSTVPARKAGTPAATSNTTAVMRVAGIN